MSTLLSIDPGMNTGWAFWDSGRLVDYGVIKLKHQSLEVDLIHASMAYSTIFTTWKPERVAIEYPGIWGGSTVSMASAFSGDLIKLAAMVGCYVSISMEASIRLIPPNKWMGQLNKEAVAIRVTRATGLEIKSSHINDAIGIGLFLYNKLHVQNITKPFRTK